MAEALFAAGVSPLHADGASAVPLYRELQRRLTRALSLAMQAFDDAEKVTDPALQLRNYADAFLGYISLMAGFAMLMLAAPDGPWRIVVFILLTIGNDIGGYATGVLFGRHPIAPQVSPKKSWEGFAGSLVVQCLIGVAAFIWVFDAPWWQGLIMGAVLTVTATAGDFIESAIKRDIGVKDMGSLLPGHGGIMDRLDSLVINAFAAWALFALFLGQG